MMSPRTTDLPTLTHEQLLARIQELADALQRALEEAHLRRTTIETGQPLFPRVTLKHLKRISDELSGTIELVIDTPPAHDVRMRPDEANEARSQLRPVRRKKSR